MNLIKSIGRVAFLILSLAWTNNNAYSQTISTGAINGSPFTFGNIVSVPFTITGTFKPDNVFTAQLSDTLGSFTGTTTTIGALASATAGTIIATLPASGTSSSLYRIRVNSSDSAITGGDNGVNLIIDSLSPGTSYIVTNTNGSGEGSLYQAITDANSSVGTKDTITFNIPVTSPVIIPLSTNLPALIDNAGVVIDGSTQPANGYSGISPKIIISGSSGLSLTGQNCEIYGLYLSGVTVSIGASGAAGSNFIIGVPGKGNVINNSTSNNGISVGSGVRGGTIQANKIGTDTTGTLMSKLSCGISLACTNVLVGGNSENQEGNLISGNGYNMSITGSYNSIKGNIIGPDINGNFITGSASSDGIYIFTGQGHNIIGGSLPGEGNIIAYNVMSTYTGGGIEMESSANNLISRNSFYCNGGWGPVELIGGNNSYAAPVITAANDTGAKGTSQPKAIIELFYNQTGCTQSTSATCQGKTYIATTIADSTGKWFYSGHLNDGMDITATATDSVNNTSTFSGCVLVNFFNSINIISSEVGLSIYPSPAQNELNVQSVGVSGEFNIKLVNLIGDVLVESTNVLSPGNIFKIDVPSLENGIYIVTMNDNASTRIVRKVLILR